MVLIRPLNAALAVSTSCYDRASVGILIRHAAMAQFQRLALEAAFKHSAFARNTLLLYNVSRTLLRDPNQVA